MLLTLLLPSPFHTPPKAATKCRTLIKNANWLYTMHRNRYNQNAHQSPRNFSQNKPSKSSFVFFPAPCPANCWLGGSGWFAALRSNPAKPPSTSWWPFDCDANPFDRPIKSSRLLPVDDDAVGGISAAEGKATLWGVTFRPSSPDMLDTGDFWADAGAAPSKSMSRRFSLLAWDGGGAPETAAAAAAAARGFSRAFCNCSLFNC